MASGQIHAVFRQIHRLFGAGSMSGLSEGQLLARFVEKKDESAFEALVSRYGPMVLGVCRQMLDDPHAADDAFQATFLVLVRRAASIRDPDLLGNWLYGVTLKVAWRARADRAKRRQRETEGAAVRSEFLGDRPAFDDPDLGPILHEELARLPEKYRAPVVLCLLDGRTHEEAAKRLGWPVGSVKGRLSRAKDLLRERLSRRGMTASAALVVATLEGVAGAAVPPVLLDQTVKAAMALAAGGAVAAGLASASAIALSEGVVTSMTLAKIKYGVVAVVGLALATGGAALGRQGAGPGLVVQDTAKTEVKQSNSPRTEEPKLLDPNEKTDTSKATAPLQPRDIAAEIDRMIADTPLPAEESEQKLNRDREEIARRALVAMMAFYENGTLTIDRLLQAAQTYSEAKAAAASNPADRIKAMEGYVRLSRGIVEREKQKYEIGNGSMPNVNEAELRLADARLMLARARAEGKSAPQAPAKASAKKNPNLDDGVESDNPSADEKIVEALRKPTSMPFANETPLEDVIKFIQNDTVSKDFPQGLPIYVDPSGLELAEKTMASPIRINLEGIMLKTSLRLVLKQLNMGYYIKHGLLIITALEDEDFKNATNPGWFERERKQMQEQMEAMKKMGAGGGFGGGGGGGFGGMSPRIRSAPPAQEEAGPAQPTKPGEASPIAKP